MKYSLVFLALFLLTACNEEPPTTEPPTPVETDAPPAANTLSDTERTEGWQLLFDGKTTDGWRGYNHETFPTRGWEIDDSGNLTVHASGGEEDGFGGDIITEQQYENFDLQLEFMVSDTGNSGILYRVVEVEHTPIWHNAPEYQILDNDYYLSVPEEVLGINMKNKLTGEQYDMYGAPEDYTRPLGEWNQARITIQDDRVTHYLNGAKTAEFTIGSPDYQERLAASKFKDYPGFAQTRRGHIGLQDHGHLIKFRNIKIREL